MYRAKRKQGARGADVQISLLLVKRPCSLLAVSALCSYIFNEKKPEWSSHLTLSKKPKTSIYQNAKLFLQDLLQKL